MPDLRTYRAPFRLGRSTVRYTMFGQTREATIYHLGWVHLIHKPA